MILLWKVKFLYFKFMVNKINENFFYFMNNIFFYFNDICVNCYYFFFDGDFYRNRYLIEMFGVDVS